MSIWVHRDNIDVKTGENIYKECTIVEELDQYNISKGHEPRAVLMFKKDSTKQFFLIPYRIAVKYGFKQNNPYWKQIVHVYIDENGNNRYLPQFTGDFRDYQKEVIPEIIECMQKNNTVIIGLPPGWGKTIIAAYLIWLIGLLAVVIVKQERVYIGWQKTFKKVLPQARVWLVGDEPMPEKFDIILCMNERTHHVPFYIKMQVGTLIIDEAHTISTYTQVDTFLDWAPKYVILETATLKASTFWRMSAAVAAEDGVFRISKVPYNFYVVRTGVFGDQKRNVNGDLISASVQRSLIQNLTRTKIVQSIIYNHVNYRKFICLQTVTQDIDENIIRFNHLGISCDTLWGDKKTYSQSQVLFGTYGKISTGFDEENSCDNYWIIPVKSNTMIFINSVLSPWLLIQAMGRCMRTLDEVPAFIFLLDDNSNVKNHLKANEWLIKLTNGNIIYVDFKQPFIPMSKGYIFQTIYMPGQYYKILYSHEYNDFLQFGFYIGNDTERAGGYIMMQTAESVMYYKNLMCPKTKCYILTVHMCNFHITNGNITQKDGIVFCLHSIFLKNIIRVDNI